MKCDSDSTAIRGGLGRSANATVLSLFLWSCQMRKLKCFGKWNPPSRPEFPLKVREIIWDSRAATEVEAEIFQLRFWLLWAGLLTIFGLLAVFSLALALINAFLWLSGRHCARVFSVFWSIYIYIVCCITWDPLRSDPLSWLLVLASDLCRRWGNWTNDWHIAATHL